MTHKAVNSYKSVVFFSKFTRVILPHGTCNFVMLLKTEKILETFSLTSCAALLRIQVFCQSKVYLFQLCSTRSHCFFCRFFAKCR